MYKIPALDTVAGVAVLHQNTKSIDSRRDDFTSIQYYLKFEISKRSRICLVSVIRSLLASVNTLLSSMTVFKDSIHMGSISPSNTIHFGPSPGMLA